MGGRGSSSGMSSGGGITSLDVWNKADEMAELIMDSGKASYVKVNRSEAVHEENNIDRDYYSISLFGRKGRKNILKRTIPLGYYDNNTKKYVPKQIGGVEATNVFDYVSKRK